MKHYYSKVNRGNQRKRGKTTKHTIHFQEEEKASTTKPKITRPVPHTMPSSVITPENQPKSLTKETTTTVVDLETKLFQIVESRAETTSQVEPSQPIIVVDIRDIEISKELGAGSFSCAYEIKSIRKRPIRNTILKKLSPKVTANPLLFASVSSDLIIEGKILASIQHPNVISIQGWSGPDMLQKYINGDKESCFLILDRLDENLEDRLAKWENAKPSIWNYPSKRKSLEYALLRDKCHSALNLAKGLEHLHIHRILHRDLKPQNIGFNASGTLKIFDFDLARVLPSEEDDEKAFNLTAKVGSPRYMAPEVASGKPYNLKADIYSFGLLAYQILTLKTPWKGQDYNWSTSNKSLPKSWSADIRLVMENTVSHDGFDRPKAQDIVAVLESATSNIDEDSVNIPDSFADLFCAVPTYEDVEEMFCLSDICADPCDPCANKPNKAVT